LAAFEKNTDPVHEDRRKNYQTGHDRLVVARAQGMDAGYQQEGDEDIQNEIDMQQLEMVDKGIDHQDE
jgi:hypothetical protein